MPEGDAPTTAPPLDLPDDVFVVYRTHTDGDRRLYFGVRLQSRAAIEERVARAVDAPDCEVRCTAVDSVDVEGVDDVVARDVIVVEPTDVGVDGVPWTNVALFVATTLSTLYAGSLWYHIDLSNPVDALRAWPFTLAIMGVLGVHEMGHYLFSRYHGVDATLPYFIPVPTLIGTMGAVIRMKGRIPDRDALFDIGVAGPIAGLVATVVVTVVGLHLDPVTVPETVRSEPGAVRVVIGFPPLMHILAWVTGQPLAYPEGQAVNPVVIGGWVGMFVTFLNLIPVGQLDGGHVLRAILGSRYERYAVLVPGVLFALAAYVEFVRDAPGNAALIWVVWGVIAAFLTVAGSVRPVEDAEPLDRRRVAVGALTLVVGLLCFTPVPIAIIQ
jgi:membrane-associated protease RseP (regulator of RpoE activity)